MVVSKVDFNDAMVQINESYAKQNARIEKLEKLVEELSKPKTTTKATTAKAKTDAGQ